MGCFFFEGRYHVGDKWIYFIDRMSLMSMLHSLMPILTF